MNKLTSGEGEDNVYSVKCLILFWLGDTDVSDLKDGKT